MCALVQHVSVMNVSAAVQEEACAVLVNMGKQSEWNVSVNRVSLKMAG